MSIGTAVAVCTVVMISGCGGNDDEAAPSAKAGSGGGAGPLTPLPTVPAWAQALMGVDTGHGFSKSRDCEGAFDGVYNVHSTAPLGAQANGWAWLVTAKAAPTQIVIADASGKIMGAGAIDYDRPDVPATLGEVTSKRVGWHAVMSDDTGEATAMALLPGNVLCVIGAKPVK